MTNTQLVGDVGGTNARFALLDDAGNPHATRTLRTDDFSSLSSAISTYLAEQELDSVDEAAVAVATPVIGDEVKLTNNHWSFSIENTRKSMGLNRLHVVNDFTALALSVKHLPEEELIKVGGGEALERHAIAIIGPGTGLGVSGLVPCGDSWNALEGEGGHVSLGVRTPREFAVYQQLMQRFRHVSAERFLSGPGLVNIVNALRELDGLPAREFSPAEVTEFGMYDFLRREGSLDNDTGYSVDETDRQSCEEALQMFCGLLGSCAGNLVLTLGAEGGVFIGGGIVPRLGDFFVQSQFRHDFEAKGRMQAYLESVPSYVIHSPYPALIGAAQLLK
ncbi:MAG: glucokinase [Granulosicoccus sp.]